MLRLRFANWRKGFRIDSVAPDTRSPEIQLAEANQESARRWELARRPRITSGPVPPWQVWWSEAVSYRWLQPRPESDIEPWLPCTPITLTGLSLIWGQRIARGGVVEFMLRDRSIVRVKAKVQA